jgi:hypothetical protein
MWNGLDELLHAAGVVRDIHDDRRLLQHTPEGILLAVEYTLKTDLHCGGLGVPVTCRIDRIGELTNPVTGQACDPHSAPTRGG